MRCAIVGIGCLGPGLPDFRAAQAVLTGRDPYRDEKAILPPPAFLPANERRRTSPSVRAALAASLEAVERAGLGERDHAAVFASALGEGQALHRILDAVTRPDGNVSPTLFHNSVHNAASGYWTIARRCTAPATSLAAGEFSFAVGLLEAMIQVQTSTLPILLTVYDAPYPPPLSQACDIGAVFAASFVLRGVAAANGTAIATIEVEFCPGAGTAPLRPSDLAVRVQANPAAHALPLLRALAAGETLAVTLPYHRDAHLALRQSPC